MPQQRRSGLIIGLMALGLLAGAALTAGPAQAVDAVGPFYAKPAWDQKLPVNTRFVVLTNWGSKAVLDKETGLVWEKLPNSTATPGWSAARDACTARTTGNRTGWRLPSIHELNSLVDPSLAGSGTPTLPPGHPFLTVQSATYWSATTYAGCPNCFAALTVEFFAGNAFTFGKTNDTILAWCARGGMNAAAY